MTILMLPWPWSKALQVITTFDATPVESIPKDWRGAVVCVRKFRSRMEIAFLSCAKDDWQRFEAVDWRTRDLLLVEPDKLEKLPRVNVFRPV